MASRFARDAADLALVPEDPALAGLPVEWPCNTTVRFQAGRIPSRHAKCECSCVLPTAAVCRWLVLLLSRLLSGHRWPDTAPASDAGIGHYQAPSWSLSSGQLSGSRPSPGCDQAAFMVSMSRPCFRVRREPAQNEGEGGRAHGVEVAVAQDAAAAGQGVFAQLPGRLVLADRTQADGQASDLSHISWRTCVADQLSDHTLASARIRPIRWQARWQARWPGTLARPDDADDADCGSSDTLPRQLCCSR